MASNSATKKFQVDISTNPSTIIVTAEPVASNIPETFPIANILQVTPIFFDYRSATGPQIKAVTLYQNTPNRVSFLGVYTIADILVGSTFTITGSIGNNGTYTVVNVTNNGTTTVVTVAESITTGTNDGSVNFTPTTGTVENNASGDSFRETYPFPTMTVLVIETNNGIKQSWELQNITNHATWSTGTKAALKVAALAINALL